MGPIPEGARHAPATRRERAAALAAHACAEDGDALGPGGWKPAAGDPTAGERARHQIGRASCRERVCQYVYISVVAVSLKKQSNHDTDAVCFQLSHKVHEAQITG